MSSNIVVTLHALLPVSGAANRQDQRSPQRKRTVIVLSYLFFCRRCQEVGMPFAKLDRTGIIQNALIVLNEEGLAGLSLRRLAGRLNVTVSSLYWHVQDRAALEALMVEALYRQCLETTPDFASWQDWLTGFAEKIWSIQHSVRDFRRLVATATLEPEVRDELRALVVTSLVRRGVAPDTALTMQMAVNALVTGWSTLQRDDTARERFGSALDGMILGWERLLKT